MNLYYSLLLDFIVYYSIVTSIDTENKSSLIIRYGPRSMKDDQIISVNNSSIGYLLTKIINKHKLREKRDSTDSMDIKAIQATINDHRTMIEDNRIMINNIINNSVNDNSIQQTISSHYSTIAPIWNSWRDIALIFLVSVIIVKVVYFCACQVQLRPWDYLVSRIFQRHDTRQSQKRKYPPTVPRSLVKTIEEDYGNIHHNEDINN